MKNRTPSSWSKSSLTPLLFYLILNPVNFVQAQNPCSSIRIKEEIRNVSCSGLNDGRIKLQIKGGSPPYKFLWSNGAGTEKVGANLSPGNYKVTIVDSENCQVTRNFRVGGIEPMDIDSQVLSDSEDGGPRQLQVRVRGGAEPYKYLLFKESGPWVDIDQNSNIVKKIEPGNYMGAVVDANGCAKSFRVKVE